MDPGCAPQRVLLAHPLNEFTQVAINPRSPEGMAQSVNSGTEDTAEAIRAFLDKREPKFKGR